MRVVIALGGNALLRRGQPLTAENQRANIRQAAAQIARIAQVVDQGRSHEIVIAHGNGPQVGLLALQAASYVEVPAYPLDVLGAQTEAMIGYVIEQELGNLLPADQPLATILTMVEVDPEDPAFATPTKPIGPVYPRAHAEVLAASAGWTIAADGDGYRRVVASPEPRRIFEIRPIRQLLEAGTIVVCAGGGGIPTAFGPDGTLHGVEAVVDKDATAAMLAINLSADLLVIATDVDGIYTGWPGPDRQRLERSTPNELDTFALDAGSMGPKIKAASQFVRTTGRPAVIGALDDLAALVAGTAGTRIV
ncbi:MAG: carbamate kinase [Propionibacteriales bacterium]|nr:carbamate kinase [Propionibacteriales bacterium]